MATPDVTDYFPERIWLKPQGGPIHHNPDHPCVLWYSHAGEGRVAYVQVDVPAKKRKRRAKSTAKEKIT